MSVPILTQKPPGTTPTKFTKEPCAILPRRRERSGGGLRPSFTLLLVSTNMHRVRSGAGIAICGATVVILTHFAGGGYEIQSGYVEHPVVRLVSLVAWGALVGGALGWLAGASPPRASIPVGLAFLAGIAGFVVGMVIGVKALGEGLIDGNSSRLLTSALIGAGIGWSLGACTGLALARDVAPPTRTESWMLRGVGLAALLLGLVTARFEATLVGPGGLHTRFLTSLQAATVVDAAILGLTLVIAGGRVHAIPSRTPPEPRSEARFMSLLGKTGIVFGCIISTSVFVLAFQARTAVETSIQARANDRTAYSLASAASEYMSKKGMYPADLEALLAAGGKIERGSYVNFVGVVPGGFCVRIGTDIGNDYGGPPYFSVVVHPRPPKARSWTDSEGWLGDSCRSDRPGRS